MSWIETYRGTVHRWEADNVEHFTVAYYFARLEDATLALVEALGLGDDALGGRVLALARCRVRYLRELRVGDILHIESGVLRADDGGITFAHRVFDTGDGALCTTVEERAVVVDAATRAPAHLSPVEIERVLSHRVEWDEPPAKSAGAPSGDARLVEAARDTIKPWEVDRNGFAAQPAFIHRFTAANGHVLGAFGLTPAYLRRERRGFSTFEFDLAIPGALRAGDLVRVQSGLVHVGNSSMRILHRMTNVRTGAVVATLEQAGVCLDLDARRPSPLPDELRTRAVGVFGLAAAGDGRGTGARA
jgi:acyl-CoA thioesterase FadM